MSAQDLSSVKKVDYHTTDLSYEDFRKLALNPNLSPDEKIGFPDAYRVGLNDVLLADIYAKLPAMRMAGTTTVDIGPGCGSLIKAILADTSIQKTNLVLVDSPEMLAQIPAAPHSYKVAGMFPTNLAAVQEAAPQGVDSLLCYSVLHYIYTDTNLFRFLDAVITLLKPGGRALIGDIPNISKRRRFFASPTGVAFHQKFMNTTDKPLVDWNRVETDKIDDAVLNGLIQRAQAAGCDAYLMPQDPRLAMANRRDDLLICKP